MTSLDNVTPIGVAAILREGERARRIPSAASYWATTEGDIITTRNGKVRRLRPGLQTNGYRQVDLVRDDGTKWRPLVHRVVMLALVGPPPDERGVVYEIHHGDCNKQNNALSNLAYLSKGRHVQITIGHGKSNVRLDPVSVWQLRCRALGEPISDIVAEASLAFGVNPVQLRRVLRGKSWAWVPFPEDGPTAETLAEALQVSLARAADLLMVTGLRKMAA